MALQTTGGVVIGLWDLGRSESSQAARRHTPYLQPRWAHPLLPRHPALTRISLLVELMSGSPELLPSMCLVQKWPRDPGREEPAPQAPGTTSPDRVGDTLWAPSAGYWAGCVPVSEMVSVLSPGWWVSKKGLEVIV